MKAKILSMTLVAAFFGVTSCDQLETEGSGGSTIIKTDITTNTT